MSSGNDFLDALQRMMQERDVNHHAKRARAHMNAAERWPAGSTIRRMHEDAARSDARLALEAAA